MRTSKTLKLFGLIVILAFVLIDFGACKTNDGADPDPIEYALNVKVIYNRDPSKITCPEGKDAFNVFHVVTKSGTNDQYLSAEKIGPHKFQAVFAKVRKNYELVWYIRDRKLSDGKSECSCWTAGDLSIENGDILKIFFVSCLDPKSNKAIGVAH